MVYISAEDTKPSPEDLVHYGIKGMKWGVRKDRSKTSSKRAERQPGSI